MFYYEVEFFDENKVASDKGLIAAKSYGEAAQQIAEYYGLDNIFSVNVAELETILAYDDLKEQFNFCSGVATGETRMTQNHLH